MNKSKTKARKLLLDITEPEISNCNACECLRVTYRTTLSGRLGSDVEFIVKLIEEFQTFFAGFCDLDVKFLKICYFSVIFHSKCLKMI